MIIDLNILKNNHSIIMLLLNQSYQFPLPRVKNQTCLSNTINTSFHTNFYCTKMKKEKEN